MGIYVIGDLHLSVAAKKPMDIFSGWSGHAEKLIASWNSKITGADTVVLVGDTSWGDSIPQAMPDFRLLHNLPGRKLLIKGNHDYWWGSMKKMRDSLDHYGLESIEILHNNSFYVEGKHLCGSRGWIFENGQPHDEKLVRREAIRIEASLKARGTQPGETILFLHYPPLYANQSIERYLELMELYNVSRCYYGHIHGHAHKLAVQGSHCGVAFHMVSADYLGFEPLRIN